MLIYATDADLTDDGWLVEAPGNVTALLRQASGIVRHATRAARYDVDSAGKPSDPEYIQAFKDATCAQVAYWADNDIDPSRPIASIVSSKSMGDRSITFADAETSAAARAASVTGLVQEAWTILSSAGLLNGQPSVR